MIRTFVFFDLETSGLIQGNFIPNITEMALVAVSRNNLLDTVDGPPRVLHKLLLPVCPPVKIPKMVELFTHLSNDNLKEAQCFDQGKYNLIRSFLNQLPDPICFVAHNGIKFDYPILLDEVKRVNETFSDSVLCIDTLHLFKEFFSQTTKSEKDTNTVRTGSQTGSSDPSSFVHDDLHSLLNDGLDNELVDALDLVMRERYMHKTDALLETKNHEQPPQNPNSDQFESNTKTPSCKHFCAMQAAINEKTPEGQLIKSDGKHPPYRKGKHVVRKKLNFTDNKPQNFKLGTLYHHMLGKTAQQLHTAEGDCLSMLCCAIKVSTFFVEWADRNALPLINYQKQ